LLLAHDIVSRQPAIETGVPIRKPGVVVLTVVLAVTVRILAVELIPFRQAIQ
jgi:hypothetical protein